MQQKTLRELLSQSWEIYTTHFKLLFVSVLLLIVPFVLATDLLVPTPSDEDYLEYETQFSIIDPISEPDAFAKALLLPPGASEDMFWWLSGLQIATGLLGMLLTIFVVRATAQAVAGKEPNLTSIATDSARDWPVVVVTSVITTAGLLVAFLLFILPGIALSVFWAFVTPAIVIGGQKYFKAIGASYAMVKGRFWQVLGRFTVVIGAIFIVSFAIGSATANLIIYQGVESLIGTIVQLIALFSTVFMTVYFLDLKKLEEKPVQEFPEEASDDEE